MNVGINVGNVTWFPYLWARMETALPANPPPLPPPARSRLRWWIHLVLLASYPLAISILGWTMGSTDRTLLPNTTRGLVTSMSFELLVFSTVFALAWFASRASTDALLLRWSGGPLPILKGLGYSVALRVAIGIVMAVAVGVYVAVQGGSLASLEKFRPKTEQVVDLQALATDPVYLALMLTFVSFVVAGLREELWRTGVLAGLTELFPRRFGGRRGRFAAVAVAAVIFGLGHLPQGWGGVALTAGLGLGLGAIMVWHESVWEAVFAHGFFDATSFALLVLLKDVVTKLIPTA